MRRMAAGNGGCDLVQYAPRDERGHCTLQVFVRMRAKRAEFPTKYFNQFSVVAKTEELEVAESLIDSPLRAFSLRSVFGQTRHN
jgi:hypothetical protein